jgi:hypothetical protein
MSEFAELLERFRRGAEIVASSATGAAGSELDYVPGPGKWSVRQILAHVADAEIVGAERFRRVIAEDDAALVAYDQDAWARNLDYTRRRIAQSLETFRHIRAESHGLLKDLPAEAFDRKGVHSVRGPISLLDLLRIYASHAEQHAEQIRAVRSAYKESKKT